MDCDEIMQMARAAGIENWWDKANADQLSYEAALKRFAALVSAAERAAPSILDDVWRDAMRYRFVRVADKVPISREAARDPAAYDEAIDRAMRERGCGGLPRPEGFSRDPTQAVLGRSPPAASIATRSATGGACSICRPTPGGHSPTWPRTPTGLTPEVRCA
jgi:hypothetical protein